MINVIPFSAADYRNAMTVLDDDSKHRLSETQDKNSTVRLSLLSYPPQFDSVATTCRISFWSSDGL